MRSALLHAFLSTVIAVSWLAPARALAQSAADQAPGQVKKREGAKSAKDYAPGQAKKAAAAAQQERTAQKPPEIGFRKADINRDGKLSRAEVAKGFTPNVHKFFDKMDVNKDGFVTVEERNNYLYPGYKPKPR